ncbi:hypothetical protein ACTXT7_004097 [Hymenolepis weldensis]
MDDSFREKIDPRKQEPKLDATKFEIQAQDKPLSVQIALLEKQPRRFPLPKDDPRSTIPYVALKLTWKRPAEFANTQGLLAYKVSARPVKLPLIATEARVPGSGEYVSVIEAKQAGGWVEGTRVLANVSTESFTSTERDDLGKLITK